MKNSTFLKISGLLGFLLLLLPTCKKPNPCIKSLIERDEKLLQQGDSVILRGREMSLEPYRAALEKLRAEELQLFNEARDCDFGEDLRAYNYWHRSRFKFPGKIEQELQRLQRDSIK